MGEPLRALIVEDSPDDAELILRELRRGGFEVHHQRVETADQLVQALSSADWDALIADYSLPSFSCLDALREVQERQLDLPFIIVSGVITEETAVAAMRSGAHDFVLKDHLARLCPAIARELREARLRRDRRKVEQELSALRERSAVEIQRSRDELDVVLRGVAEGIIAEEAGGKVIYVNDCAARLSSAASPAAMLAEGSASITARFDFSDEAGHPLRPEVLPPPVALSTGRVVEQLVQARERATGQERWFLITSTPMFDERRDAWLAITIFRDITDRKREAAASAFLSDASAALASSLDYASTVRTLARLAVPVLGDWCAVELNNDEMLPGSSVSVASADPRENDLAQALQCVTVTGAHTIFGTPSALATGRAAIHSDLSEASIRDAVRHAGHRELLLEIRPRSAISVPLSVKNRVFGAMTIISTQPGRQYTAEDLVLAEELGRRGSLAIENARLFRRTQEAVAARDEFLSIASHELRTPITTLLLQLQRLQKLVDAHRLPGLDGPAGESLFRAVRQTKRLITLVERLFDVSRVSVGRFSLQSEEIDLAVLLNELVERSFEDAEWAGSPVHLDAAGPLIGRWDRLRLEQLITNLLSNAFKYGNRKPIVVTAEGTASSVRLSVADLGIGINQKDLRRIFDRFERAVSADHYGGLGLGLFIARQIAVAHGGSIEVESQPGAGSKFVVILPREPVLSSTGSREPGYTSTLWRPEPEGARR